MWTEWPQKLVSKTQVDKPGSRDFWRLANVVDVQSFDNFAGDILRLLAKLFGEWHRNVRLVIAMAWVTRNRDALGVTARIFDIAIQGLLEAILDQGE